MSIPAERLHRQHLAKPRITPAEVVSAFGAMQAQEYAHAKWAVAMRAAKATDADIEAAFARGEILRTHPMRGTHHFVAPADIRWLLALTAPRMRQRTQSRWRELELDDKTFAKSEALLRRVLAGGKQLSRPELVPLFARAGISTAGQRMPHILGRAELDGVICSGARKGKQITFALLEDRVPKAEALTREASLAELARRYFTTRGPATVQDFVWWTGLAVSDAKAAVALADREVASEVIDGTTYYRGNTRSASKLPAQAFLLGAYDEFAVAYRDRSAIGTPPAKPKNFGEATLLGPVIVVAGQVVGSWRRTIKPKSVEIELEPWRPLKPREREAVDAACDRYARFLGLPRT